ncbi:Thioredoxin H-type [Hibiscus syriacus]|uniref:Thioredoxin H-type n=1 Tax=Hibiscus syriacus TaxID=106335 RepID=A0A6A2XF11_HIBSY|nr:Thioredoxin H-type [Hibiscus syriacus]
MFGCLSNNLQSKDHLYMIIQANNLNRLGVHSGGWNVVSVALLVLFKGQWANRIGFLRNFLPSVIVSSLGLVFGGTTYLFFLALFASLLVGWFLLGTYCFKNCSFFMFFNLNSINVVEDMPLIFMAIDSPLKNEIKMAAEEGQVTACHSLQAWNEQLQECNESKKTGGGWFDSLHLVWTLPLYLTIPGGTSQEIPSVTFLKVDVDELKDVAADWAVEAMPTFMFSGG